MASKLPDISALRLISAYRASSLVASTGPLARFLDEADRGPWTMAP
jgi:hypothetical protein